ncbi:augmin complex subunit dgt2-like [Musca vetustissima]|uniref:augmin complex subunit dgt2-like n=1 Tax=Musca vetustissima TaxID=27455 RepID=UPI002AB6D353|nr:augmin complex subunit dgt2-like [Musca vetustissima]
MDCNNETTRILNSETIEQLQKARDEELAKVRKLRLVLKELKQLNCNKMLIPDKEQIEKTLKVIKIGNYLYLNEKRSECLLDLNELCKVNLNYTERKAVRQQLSEKLHANLTRIQDFGTKMRDELPELFCDSESPHEEILSLEMQRKSDCEHLASLRNKKCHFLKVAADLKMGPYLAYELDVAYAKARQNQTKVNVLRGYFINELLSRTEHSLKAIREVETYINDDLENELYTSN